MAMEEIYLCLLFVLIGHICLLFFDLFFKSCSLHPYLIFLNRTGFQISPLRISWFSSTFNRQLQKWGTSYMKLQLAWFSAGAWVSVLLMPLSVYLILHTIVTALKSSFSFGHSLRYSEEKQGIAHTTLLVEPFVPGWNLPTSDLGYYLITLFFSSVIHELGHAMAAIREDAHLAGFTFSIFLVVPIVITHLDHIDTLPPFRQLKIYCAGVWHNIFLALVAAVVATTLPLFVYPFYDYGAGVQLTDIKKGSSVSSEGGLIVGDRITQINDCAVFESSGWYSCLSKVRHESSTGFCIPDLLVKEHDESVPAKHNSETGRVDCCDHDSFRHLCFEYIGADDEPLPLPQHTCLVVRTVVEASSLTCTAHSSCPSHLHCFRPSLGNSTKLIRLYRKNGPVVLFLGHPAEVFSSVVITDFVPIYRWMPSWLPDGTIKLCQFLTLFSSGLAILNIIPCFYFDGQHICRALLDLLLAKRVPASSARQAISLCITVLGSLLLIIYLIVMFFVTI